jgi:hypothetical protein
MQQSFLLKNYAVKHISSIFASVFHGIRFKVRRLFVVTTSNFFVPASSGVEINGIGVFVGSYACEKK